MKKKKTDIQIFKESVVDENGADRREEQMELHTDTKDSSRSNTISPEEPTAEQKEGTIKTDSKQEEGSVSIKNLMSEETYNATEQAAKEMVENIKNKTDTPLNIFLGAVKKAKDAKAAREEKEREQMQHEPIEVMDIDELMNAIQHDQLPYCDISEDITAIQVVKKELEQLGISETTLGYKIILSIVEDFSAEALGHRPTEDEIIENAMKRFNVKRNSVTAALTQFVRKAKFENSVFIPILKKISKEQLKWNAVLNEFIDFAE